jgi:hypothetical protein
MTVSGAYGRDYKSAKDMKADWDANKDFVLRSMEGSGYVNKVQVPGVKVMGRYKRDMNVCKLQ